MTETAAGAAPTWRRAVTFEFIRLLALGGVFALVVAHFLPVRPPPAPVEIDLPAGWSKIAWPYLRDQFDAGLAARCAGPACPRPFDITIRPKRGFCDCERGVYDDIVLREVGDLDLAGSFTPQAPGAPVTVGTMGGRSRLHAGSDGAGAVSLALHSGCDVIIVTARAATGAGLEAAMFEFLRSEPVAGWLAGLLKDDKGSARRPVT